MSISDEELLKQLAEQEATLAPAAPAAAALSPAQAALPDLGGMDAPGAAMLHGANALAFKSLPAVTDVLDKINAGFNTARGGIRSVMPWAVPAEDIPRMSGEDTKRALADAKEKHPYASTAGDIGGSVVRDLTVGKLLPFAKGGTLGASVGKQAAVGGIASGTEEGIKAVRGEEVDPMNLLLGPTLGAAGGAVGHGLSRVVDPVQSLIGATFPKFAPAAQQAAATGLKEAEKFGVKASAPEALELGGLLTKNPAAQVAGRETAQTATERGLIEPTSEAVRQSGNLGRLTAREAALETERKAAEAGVGEVPKSLTGGGVGVQAENARKLVSRAFADAENKVGKASPEMWNHAKTYLNNVAEGTLDDAERAATKEAMGKIDDLIAKRTPEVAEVNRLAGEQAGAGRVRSVLEMPEPIVAPKSGFEKVLDFATKSPATRGGAALGGALGTKLYGPMGGAAGGALGGAAGAGVDKLARSVMAKGTGKVAGMLADNPLELLRRAGSPSEARDALSLMVRHGIIDEGTALLMQSRGFKELSGSR